jgi:putative polyketide hydroxylase
VNRCDIAVIGAGPVGLTLLTALRRHGIDAVGIDGGPGPTRYPKSRLLSARSMEIFRRLGVAAEVKAAGLDAQWCQRLVVRRSVSGPEVGRIERPPSAGRSPEAPVLCTQDSLERVLAAGLEDRFPAAVRWRHEAVKIEPDDLGVTVRARGRDGDEQAWRAAYVVCADGIRGLSGTLPGAGTRRVFARQVSLRAAVALSPWTDAAPAFITYLVDRGLSAQLLVVDGKDDWIIASLARRGETALDYGPERARALLATVTGLPATDPVVSDATITDVRTWDLATRVCDTFRLGRVLRAGDAAHEILPTGAMGLNLGIADADALAWRLRAVLDGWADPAVLDGYDRERRAAAVRTAQWSRANLNAVALMLGAAARHEDQALEEATAAIGPYLDTAGIELGPAPPSGSAGSAGAVDDGRPGSRAPHVPLGAGRSTLDLYGEQPVLLVGDEAGPAAAAALAAARTAGTPLSVAGLGQGSPTCPWPPWHVRHGVGPEGAMLVRPDGYVVWRGEVTERGVRQSLEEMAAGQEPRSPG